jgi:hypothetical protein
MGRWRLPIRLAAAAEAPFVVIDKAGAAKVHGKHYSASPACARRPHYISLIHSLALFQRYYSFIIAFLIPIAFLSVSLYP